MKTIFLALSTILLLGVESCTKHYSCTGYFGAFICTNNLDTIRAEHLGQDSTWNNSNIQYYTQKGYTCFGSGGSHPIKEETGVKQYLEAQGYKCTCHY